MDPTRNTADWSKDEDSILLEKHDELHGKFAQIQLWLPGRSYNDIQQRYLILHPATRCYLKKKQLDGETVQKHIFVG